MFAKFVILIRVLVWMPAVVLFFLGHSRLGYAQQPAQGDDLLRQQIETVLQQRLSWSPQSYRLEVKQGEATLFLFKDNVARRQQAEHALARIPKLRRLYIAVSVLNEDPGKRHTDINFPVGDVFRPLIADQKEPRFFVTYATMDSPGKDFASALVGLGTNFGLIRWPGKLVNEGWQFGWFGAAFSQFNLDAPSDDLINTDYLVGFPLT